jgi:group I intron endonuclease
MIGIYKITSPSEKKYIGQSICIENRFLQYNKMNCKKQIKLYNSFLKYGTKNHIFDIIEECDICDLNKRERYWQEYYDSVDKGLNCKLTATTDKSGSLSEETKQRIREKAKGRKISEDTKKKMSNLRKGKKGYMLGRSHSEESKIKISKSGLGKKHSIETKKKIGASKIGNKYMLGKKHSLDTKSKMSKKLIGNKRGENKVMSDTEKEKLKQLFSKIIINTSNGVFYTGTKEAAFYNNINQSTLKNKLNGNLKNDTNLKYC